MVKTAEAKCYFVTRKEELGYFLDTFMGAALYFCLVFEGRGKKKKSTETFCKFSFYVLLGVLVNFLFFVVFFSPPEERSGTYVVRSQTGPFFATKFAFNLTVLNFGIKV